MGTKHLEFIPSVSDTFCVASRWLQPQLVGPKEADASAKYQRVNLSECVSCNAIDPPLSESDLPTSALGLGLFKTDEISSLESRWRSEEYVAQHSGFSTRRFPSDDSMASKNVAQRSGSNALCSSGC